MILRAVEPRNLGPFAHPTRLEIEPDLTVLTGANDTGKTFLLNLVALMCQGGTGTGLFTQAEQVNLDYINDAKPAWDHSPEITCTAEFGVSELTRRYIRGSEGWQEFVAEVRMAPGVWRRTVTSFKKGGKLTKGGPDFQKMPHVVRLPMKERIGDIIDMASPNPAETEFLRAAFGPDFAFGKIQALGEGIFANQLHRAEDRLNSQALRILPASIGLRFRVGPAEGRRDRLAVSIVDAQNGHTPLGLRGEGVRKVVTLIGALMGTDLESEHVYVLFDEPENSLHADGQHALRRLLEELAQKPTVQVIYATHSPSMINTMRPQSVRVLRREKKDGKATSVVVNRPIHENYLMVRSSLGLSPADSLLYAPVTIVVEGITEVIGLPLLLQRFRESALEGFEDVEKLLSQSHFLDGQGDNYDRLCRFAKSQGGRPIIFLDGDKVRRAEQHGVRDKHPDVPIITLPERSEFEQIVPEEVYLQALADTLEGPKEGVSAGVFHKWEEEQRPKLPQKMVFTKRIERWLQDEFDGAILDKPVVIKKALQEVAISKVNTAPFLELVKEMSRLLSPHP